MKLQTKCICPAVMSGNAWIEPNNPILCNNSHANFLLKLPTKRHTAIKYSEKHTRCSMPKWTRCYAACVIPWMLRWTHKTFWHRLLPQGAWVSLELGTSERQNTSIRLAHWRGKVSPFEPPAGQLAGLQMESALYSHLQPMHVLL
jgi:hypothetical protein